MPSFHSVIALDEIRPPQRKKQRAVGRKSKINLLAYNLGRTSPRLHLDPQSLDDKL